ncbi:PadR family transcriptional regulator [Yinghuangia soli]|uniref:PadR family transcriptional regulator n=1 Tax=Yinghuangia soli TaxID=2908204 RepID=A0AA41U3Y0_9ACTN|nr:PadR family transcriptional regulator [Yinghuangia soli]MCF2530222.1 PadR family transcriptional regulator [Yinghuangia soli]
MQLDFVILGLLAMRRFSGYDLRKWMDGPLKYIGYGVQLPQIYRRLAKLVERGWVEFDIDARDRGPDAKVYRMTDAGREALLEWARSPFEPAARPMDSDFLIRFVFGGQLHPDIAIAVVRAELEYRMAHVSPMGVLDLSDHYEPQIPELDPAWAREVHLLAHEHGYASTAAYIAWLKLTLQRLELRRQG